MHGGGMVMLCPEGPVTTPIGPGIDGHGWFPITMGGPMDPAAFASGADAIRSFLDDALERYPIDRNKLVVLGFSQGGVMAYDFFLREPERFAGLIALSSWLPAALLDGIPDREEAKLRPILVIHGTHDPMIAVDRARESRQLLLDRKLPLTYREFEMAHEISPDALREIATWIDDKVVSPIKLL
jgi:phospholipase/carboxylesterase